MDGDAPINLSGDEGGDEEVESVANKPEVLSDAKATKASKNTAQRKQKPILIGNTLKRQRKLTSPVWDEFQILDQLDANGKFQCRCNKCGVTYIAESRHGTGNMLRHSKK
ncbi:hypothetical protein L2E82_16384 [Cichorium intybus]|uniref:Uncharacterized protein n=1 Tax=Cichorium intybus TaxID=13427 RepID=A0ACB9F5W3_CICIN|nr:hypothetical protein L2E82_16384 [Cichorium intybus]